MRRYNRLSHHRLLVQRRVTISTTTSVNRYNNSKDINRLRTVSTRTGNVNTRHNVNRPHIWRLLGHLNTLSRSQSGHSMTRRQKEQALRMFHRHRAKIQLNSRRHNVTSILRLRRQHTMPTINRHRHKDHLISLQRGKYINSSRRLTKLHRRTIVNCPYTRSIAFTRQEGRDMTASSNVSRLELRDDYFSILYYRTLE